MDRNSDNKLDYCVAVDKIVDCGPHRIWRIVANDDNWQQHARSLDNGSTGEHRRRVERWMIERHRSQHHLHRCRGHFRYCLRATNAREVHWTAQLRRNSSLDAISARNGQHRESYGDLIEWPVINFRSSFAQTYTKEKNLIESNKFHWYLDLWNFHLSNQSNVIFYLILIFISLNLNSMKFRDVNQLKSYLNQIIVFYSFQWFFKLIGFKLIVGCIQGCMASTFPTKKSIRISVLHDIKKSKKITHIENVKKIYFA